MVLDAFAMVFTPTVLLVVLGGTILGILFGVIPGLTATMGVALSLPISFGMDPIPGLALLLGVYVGGANGGLIVSILFNMPGTPSNIATVWDGYPMTLKGEAGRALGVGILFSFLAGIIAFMMLIMIAPPVARFALRFAPFEYFAVTFFAITLIATLSGDDLLKGILAGVVGVSFSLFGGAPVDFYMRYTFGLWQLATGFHLLSVLVGFFAINEMIQSAGNKHNVRKFGNVAFKLKGFGLSMKEFIGQIPNLIRSTLLGVGIGVLPGIGGSVSNVVAYGVAKNASKTPEKFGTGVIDGVIAPEAANSGTVGGAMIPLLTLGIPGDAVTAIILGGLMMHGVIPGPMMFVINADIIWAVFICLMLANVVMICVQYYGIRGFIKLLRIPRPILLAVVICLCVIGAFGLNFQIFDVHAMFIFSAIGFAFAKFKMPLPPVILGFILGDILETNLRRGLMMTGGDFMPFLTSPIAAFFLILGVGAFTFSVIKNMRRNRKKAA